MTDSLLHLNLVEFSDQLASSAPTPGGGGTGALAGALAAALGQMVAALTIGKQKYADAEEELRDAAAALQTEREQLLACVERDAEAFLPLAEVYHLPKDAPGRAERMESGLHGAAEVPFSILEHTCRILDVLPVMAEKGSILAVSDAASAAALCEAALKAAAMNTKVNTRLMKDRTYAEKIETEVNHRMSEYLPIANRIYNSIYCAD